MLRIASVAFLAANVLHTLDHQRQGTERLTTEIYAGGTVISILAVVTLVMVWRRNPQALLVAAITGIWTGLGVIASHILPHWSAFSDSYPELNVDALSWVIVLAEIATAFWLGFEGLRATRARSRIASPGHA